MARQPTHFQDIADFLAAFEKQELAFLLDRKIWGFNAWQLLRKPLYYHEKNKTYGIAPQKKKEWKINQWQQLGGLIGYLATLLKLLLFQRKRDILYANSAYKLEKDQEGRYVNVFLDALVTTGAVKKYIYFETPVKGVYRTPSLVQRNVRNGARNFVVGVLQRKIRRNIELNGIATELSNRLNAFSIEQKINIKVNKTAIVDVLSRFKAEYDWHLCLFNKLKPRRLFIVDGMPSGVMAAAKKLNVEVHEFQHGFISYNKPDYIVSKAFADRKGSLVVPDKIYVFGSYFKNQLLKTGFWQTNEVEAIGNYRIQRQRDLQRATKENNERSDVVKVLFATQLTTFEEAKDFLKDIISSIPQNLRVTIKCHPREPEHHREWFSSLAQKHGSIIQYIDSKVSLVEALAKNDILISYHSTALAEGLALGYPCATIATARFPNGVHGILHSNFTDELKPVTCASDFLEIVQQFHKDRYYKIHWRKACNAIATNLYAEDYFGNLKRCFSN